MHRLRTFLLLIVMALTASAGAQTITATWAMNSLDYDGKCTLSSGADSYITNTTYAMGTAIKTVELHTVSGKNGELTVNYEHPMIGFAPNKTKVKAATAGNEITITMTIAKGHTFKPTYLRFNAAKVGTDSGTLEIHQQKNDETTETTFKTLSPARNKPASATDLACTAAEYAVNDVIVEGGKTLTYKFYFYNVATDKQLALGNISVEGVMDEAIKTISDYISAFTCDADGNQLDLLSKIKDLKNGESIFVNQKFSADPSNFTVTAVDGYTASVEYANKKAVLTITKDGKVVYSITIGFMTTSYTKHPAAKPLNRGLLSVHLSTGNLVSWRARSTDVYGKTRYRLYKNGTLVNTFTTRTNYLDTEGTVSDVYKVEVLDENDNVTEQQEASTWANQYLSIALAKAPTDTNGTNATYTPNDATCYDMDGDGEQEIVFRWEPSNTKDGASSGVTGAVFFECVKLDGTQLWRINLGQNMWASPHTITFLCYDFDGDGYGELICRTAPGTIDGEGNYVLMGDDNPFISYVSSRGRVESGPEYLTVFDGLTGAAISSCHYWPSHEDYGTSSQNDSAYGSQARVERYNATMARLDVNGKATPCAVMNHGYYSMANYMAAYYDGTEIKELWRANFSKSGEGMYGQGYHTLQSADVDGDGFDEIVVGSGVMDHDGTSLWRSGEGHGDALHIGEFDWDNPGLEVFSIMEDYDQSYDTYAMDMRDAKTGTLLWGFPKGTRDCGRGIAADFDPEHDGAEAMCQRSGSIHDSKGNAYATVDVNATGKNFRIYWTGDLYEENLDGTTITKWNGSNFETIASLSTIAPGATAINGTKNNPCVSADMLGDWREEAVYYHAVDATNGMYALDVITTNYESEYMLPYLRDDALYDNAIVWQNSTYNQPPHISYSPVLYYRNLTTGVSTVKNDVLKVTPAAYNIHGIRTNSNAKGIVIINGRKVLNK